MLTDEKAKEAFTLLFDALSGLTDGGGPLVAPSATVHIERRGPLVVGHIINDGTVLRTTVGLAKFRVRAKLAKILGRVV